MIQIDTIQKFSKDNADAALKSFGVVSKGAQAIAVETADYAKKSFEQSTATTRWSACDEFDPMRASRPNKH